MGRKNVIIWILTLVLIAAAVFFAREEQQAQVPFSFAAVTQAGTETLHYWQREDGERFVFLPSYVNLRDLVIHPNRTVRLDGRAMTYGMNCGELELDRPYALSGSVSGNLTFLRSGDTPALYIDTASGSLDIIHESKTNREKGQMRLYSQDGALDYWGKLKVIKTRGNGTFFQPKKPYSIQLSQRADLLGMGSASKWILLANFYDASQTKNKFSLDFAAAAGLPYTPESRWVDLFLNGNYMGMYLLTERNEVDPQRVALKDGQGFLITQDYYERLVEQNLPHFLTEAQVPVRIYASTWPQADMERFIQSMEHALLAPDGIDPDTGKHWTEFIDLDSWARKYLLEEILGGGDAGFLSQFFFYEGNDRDGKLFAGPPWDYDITMGYDRMEDSVPNMFYAHREACSPWLHALYGREEFYSRVTQLYGQTFYPLLKTFLEEKFPEYEAQTARAARMDMARWGEDATSETRRERSYMEARAEFLADVWLRNGDYVEVTVVMAGSIPMFGTLYALPRGTALPEVLAKKDWDWFVADTDEPFDVTQPIFEDMSVYAMFKPTAEKPAA